MQTYEPPNTFRMPLLSGYLLLKKDINNDQVYLESMMPSVPFVGIPKSHSRYIGSAYTLVGQMTALFDNETCSLYGSLIYPEVHVHDTLNWFYKGGDSMVGLYRPVWFGVPQFQQLCLITLQYQGPRPHLKGKEDLDSMVDFKRQSL